MDRNQLIGITLITIIMGCWFYFLAPKPEKQKAQQSSVTNANGKNESPAVTQHKQASTSDKAILKDSLLRLSMEGVEYAFNLRGGTLANVKLLHKKSLADSSKNIQYQYGGEWYKLPKLNASNYALFFQVISKKVQDNHQLSIELEATHDTHKLRHAYIIDPEKRTISWTIIPDDIAYWFPNATKVQFTYQAMLFPSEKETSYEQQMTRVNYMDINRDDDFLNVSSSIDETIDEPLRWISYKQRFFNTSIISVDLPIQNVRVQGYTNIESTKGMPFSTLSSRWQVPLRSNTSSINFTFYIGENDYHRLEKIGYKMQTIIDYGSGIFSFVKYINRSLILPFFDWMTSHISNIGWIIALLTICIRLITSPLVYTSYLSSAKMRALRPELQKLKKKYADDKQKYAFEQMALFRKAGVNPLGGCIPALLQIPIFIALYSFFNAHIQLRNASFLWSTDLSSFDSIVDLPFSIPFYGDHVSMFTITATITSFFISLFGMNTNASPPEMANNPAIKYMPYVFPLFMLFIFNSMPAALTWYYTVSNFITLVTQVIIHKFIIDHDKVLAKIQEKQKKVKKKSNFQKRLEAMQAMREKTKNNKK